MLKYGFFNDSNGDRVYNADDVNDFFEGLISSNGIFANVGEGFQVTAGGGLVVNVGTGKALVNNCWAKNSAKEPLTLAAANALLNRYDAIVLRWSLSNRNISFVVIQGDNASSAVKPSIKRNTSSYDICLAYVYVPAGATAITQSNIEDTRLNSSLCGYITGLIDQLDTSEFYTQLETWKLEQQALFEQWFSDLTGQLNIDTHIEEIWGEPIISEGGQTVFALPEEYEAGDIVDVYLNNIILIRGTEYTLNTANKTVTTMAAVAADNSICFRVLKSVIGLQGQ